MIYVCEAENVVLVEMEAYLAAPVLAGIWLKYLETSWVGL
jgi:hypothetical protein